MAKLSFAERLRQDRDFAKEVDSFQREAVFVALGIDPQAIVEAWDPDTRKIKISPLDFASRSGFAVAKVAPVEPDEDDDQESPVKDMTGDDLQRFMGQAVRSNNVAVLKKIRDNDPRSSVSVEAQRAIFKIKSEAK